jgi:hypothetical protein
MMNVRASRERAEDPRTNETSPVPDLTAEALEAKRPILNANPGPTCQDATDEC